jgi:DNA sulfur modification protein DndB
MAMSKKILLPALQGQFGDWLYYTALMSLDDVKERVSYANEIHKNKNLSESIQRRLDDVKRGKEISDFLIKNKDRFFNSLVVGVHGGDPQWHPLRVKALNKAHDLADIPKDEQEAIGYLELTGIEKLFALDGQHRLAGIRDALTKDTAIGADHVPVILVSHKNTVDGLLRTRKLFIMLNKRAVPVKKPDIIALDEVDIAAIVTRRLVDGHQWFSRGQIDLLRYTSNLPKGDRQFLTTLGNLYDIVNIAIRQVMGREHEKELKDADRLRLPEPRIDFYEGLTLEFFRQLAKTDDLLGKYLENPKLTALLERARAPLEPHVLFRPIGLRIFANVSGQLRKTLSLKETFSRISKAPILMTANCYEGTIWDSSRGNMTPKGESVARNLLAYQLGAEADAAKLRLQIAQWKGIPPASVQLPRRLVGKSGR